MRVTQNARRSLAAAVLALTLAGCSKDGGGPSEFNPQGTSADVTAAQDAFASEPTASFSALGNDISVVLGGSALVSTSQAMVLTRPSAVSAQFARRIASLVPRGRPGIQARTAAIPAELAGVTYVWDESTDTYVASDITGAPANGVRFMLYAVDPVLYRPVEPVVETGYVEIIDQSSETLVNVRVRVIEGAITYLDYDVVASASTSSGIVTIGGFAYNGSTRAEFTLKNTVSETASGVVLSLEYRLDVPSRDLAIDWTATFANISDTDVAVTLDLAISGPNGDVRLVGTTAAEGGTFTVKVNGETFATITVTAGGTSIAGAGGAPLTPDEEQALEAVLDSYEGSLDAFSHLLMPVS
jgi:hypothetical protein